MNDLRPLRSALGILIPTMLLAVLLAACGSGDEDGATTTASPTTTATADPAAEEAVAEYRAFAEENAADHLAQYERFATALEAEDIERAKAIYPEARMPWERIEPIAGLFGDLDPALDAREGDVPEKTWGGWHYFEKKLWVEEDVSGLAPYIAETQADAETLIEAAETVEMTPAEVATGAVDLLGEISASKITGEEERYSHTDLYDFQANVEGSEAAFDAVVPLVADQALVDEIQGRFTELYDALDAYREGDGFVSYEELSERERRELSRLVDATAEPLSQIAAQVG